MLNSLLKSNNHLFISLPLRVRSSVTVAPKSKGRFESLSKEVFEHSSIKFGLSFEPASFYNNNSIHIIKQDLFSSEDSRNYHNLIKCAVKKTRSYLIKHCPGSGKYLYDSIRTFRNVDLFLTSLVEDAKFQPGISKYARSLQKLLSQFQYQISLIYFPNYLANKYSTMICKEQLALISHELSKLLHIKPSKIVEVFPECFNQDDLFELYLIIALVRSKVIFLKSGKSLNQVTPVHFEEEVPYLIGILRDANNNRKLKTGFILRFTTVSGQKFELSITVEDFIKSFRTFLTNSILYYNSSKNIDSLESFIKGNDVFAYNSEFNSFTSNILGALLVEAYKLESSKETKGSL